MAGGHDDALPAVEAPVIIPLALPSASHGDLAGQPGPRRRLANLNGKSTPPAGNEEQKYPSSIGIGCAKLAPQQANSQLLRQLCKNAARTAVRL